VASLAKQNTKTLPFSQISHLLHALVLGLQHPSVLELELIQTQVIQTQVLRGEVGARALRNQTGGGGELSGLWERSFKRACRVPGPQNRKRPQEEISPPSELSRSLSCHNHGADGGHPVIELP